MGKNKIDKSGKQSAKNTSQEDQAMAEEFDRVIKEKLGLRAKTGNKSGQVFTAMSGVSTEEKNNLNEGPWTAQAGAKRNLEAQVAIQKEQALHKEEMAKLESSHQREEQDLINHQVLELLSLEKRHEEQTQSKQEDQAKERKIQTTEQQAQIKTQKIEHRTDRKEQRDQYKKSLSEKYAKGREKLPTDKQKQMQELEARQLSEYKSFVSEQNKAASQFEQAQANELNNPDSTKTEIQLEEEKARFEDNQLRDLEDFEQKQTNEKWGLNSKLRAESTSQMKPTVTVANQIKQDQQVKVQDLKTSQERNRENLLSSHKTSKQELLIKHENELSALSKNQVAEVKAMKLEHKSQLADLESKHNLEIKKIGEPSNQKNISHDAPELTSSSNTTPTLSSKLDKPSPSNKPNNDNDDNSQSNCRIK